MRVQQSMSGLERSTLLPSNMVGVCSAHDRTAATSDLNSGKEVIIIYAGNKIYEKAGTESGSH